MNQSTLFRAATIGAISLAIVPAVAQDAGGLRFTFGLSQRVEVSDNPSLDTPSTGQSALASTSLNFGVHSQTRTQTLSFTAGGLLRADNATNAVNGFVEPRVALSYRREAANAAISLDGSYRASDISYLRDLSEFIDENGVLVLPEDFADLNGSGTVNRFGLTAKLETGLSNPLGFFVSASRSATTYSNTTSPSLLDLRTTSFNAGANMRFSDVSRGTITLGYTETAEDEPLGTVTTSGLTGNLSFTHDLPDGEMTASFGTTRNQNGGRQTLRFGRTKDLPAGRLALSLGATRQDSSSAALIGAVSLTQTLATGSISLALNSNVSTYSSGLDQRSTTVDLGYNHTINQISSISLGASMGMTDASGTFNRIERTDLRASYSRQLPQDWTLSTGIAHHIRNEETVGRANSTTLFVSFGREFTLHP